MSRAEWKERTYAWQVEPDSLDHLCDFISDENGTLSEYCANRLLKFRMVRDWIEMDPERKAKYDSAVLARTSGMEDKVLGSLRNAASIDPRTLIHEDGSLRDADDIPDDIAHSITEFTETVSDKGSVTRKVKFTPRHQANVELGRHLGMFRERMELTGKDGAPLETDNNAVRRIAFALEKAARAKENKDGITQ